MRMRVERSPARSKSKRTPPRGEERRATTRLEPPAAGSIGSRALGTRWNRWTRDAKMFLGRAVFGAIGEMGWRRHAPRAAHGEAIPRRALAEQSQREKRSDFSDALR